MSDKKNEALRKYSDALARLEEAVLEPVSTLQADAVIQRFEFTFELMWKALKIFLDDKGIYAYSPRDVLKEGFKQKWIDDEQLVNHMLDDRNRTSHVYDKSESETIFRDIQQKYLAALKQIMARLHEIQA